MTNLNISRDFCEWHKIILRLSQSFDEVQHMHEENGGSLYARPQLVSDFIKICKLLHL